MSVALAIPLDGGDHHRLVLLRAGGAWRLRAEHDADRRSRLHEALLANLRVTADGESVARDDDGWSLPASTQRVVVLLGGHRLGALALHEPRPRIEAFRPLPPLQSRYLAQNGRPHPQTRQDRDWRRLLCTDLHSHFAGCVRGTDLVRIGAAAGVAYPWALLEQAGIRCSTHDDVPLAELSPVLQHRLARSLEVPLQHQTTFLQMEDIYRLRSPITRSPAAMVPLCRQIAADYLATGVRYAELSFASVVEAERLRALSDALPGIERTTGVRLRFLAAMSRHDDLEWDLDYIERLQALAGCRYIVGVDFMGHETNATRSFAPQIEQVARWASRARPGFVIRVHAGENPAYPENVRAALELTAGHDVELRIGHGLYGVDETTLDALVAGGHVVELNLSSNYALNNIQRADGAPLRRYLKRGVAVVLGTDGYGLYQTSIELEVRAAILSGLSGDDLQAVGRHEQAYLERARRRDDRLRALPFEVPDDTPPRHFGPHVVERLAAARREREAALAARLVALQVPQLDEADLARQLRGKLVVSIAGSWKMSWEQHPEESVLAIERALDELTRSLDVDRTVLITGGTEHGVEGRVHAAAQARGVNVLAALVWQTPPEALDPRVGAAVVVGETLYDKAAGLYALVERHGGAAVFIGGGPIVNDEIQAAYNLGIPCWLMDGIEGASSEHARQRPRSAFRTGSELAAALRELRHAPAAPGRFRHPGVNPTVDAVITRDAAGGQRELLLIRRDDSADTAPGCWALPGGFQGSRAPAGQPWVAEETERQACVRELHEETGLDLRRRADDLLLVGVYEGGGRDPRDTDTSWSRSTAFAMHLTGAAALAPVAGDDDAADARWLPLADLPRSLAFDHRRIVDDAIGLLREHGAA